MWSHVTALLVAAALTPAPASSVTVQVGPLRNRAGAVACRIYASADGFPEAPAAAGQVHRVAGDSATCRFDRLPPGRYAVAVFHDEDGDLRLAKNVLGAPTEGYGVSNNATHLMRGPSFDEAAFVVGRGEALRLEVALRY